MDGDGVKLQRSSRYAVEVKELCVMLATHWGMTSAEVSATLRGTPCARTVDTYLAEYRRTGSVAPSVGHKGVQHYDRMLDDVASQLLLEIVGQDPSLYIYEIAEKLSEQTR